MQPETLYKGHTIVPFCSEGPRYKSHYKLTPPGGVGSQWTYLTAEYTTEVAALEAALVRRRSSTKACRRGQVGDLAHTVRQTHPVTTECSSSCGQRTVRKAKAAQRGHCR